MVATEKNKKIKLNKYRSSGKFHITFFLSFKFLSNIIYKFWIIIKKFAEDALQFLPQQIHWLWTTTYWKLNSTYISSPFSKCKTLINNAYDNSRYLPDQVELNSEKKVKIDSLESALDRENSISGKFSNKLVNSRFLVLF